MAGRNAIERVNEKAIVWFRRAALQYQSGRVMEAEECLERHWDYLCIAADMQKSSKPARPQPPSFYFGELRNPLPTPKYEKKVKLPPPVVEGASPTEKLSNLAATWFSRAALLYRIGRYEESQLHLRKRWSCLCSLAELHNLNSPEPPREPEYYFGPPGDESDWLDDGSGVPRNPIPGSDDTSIALTVPPKQDE